MCKMLSDRTSKPCVIENDANIAYYGEYVCGAGQGSDNMVFFTLGTEARDNFTTILAEVPLANMFGYATVIRGMSKGMGTFTMEMASYAKVPVRISEEILFKRREENQKV